MERTPILACWNTDTTLSLLMWRPELHWFWAATPPRRASMAAISWRNTASPPPWFCGAVILEWRPCPDICGPSTGVCSLERYRDRPRWGYADTRCVVGNNVVHYVAYDSRKNIDSYLDDLGGDAIHNKPSSVQTPWESSPLSESVAPLGVVLGRKSVKGVTDPAHILFTEVMGCRVGGLRR